MAPSSRVLRSTVLAPRGSSDATEGQEDAAAALEVGPDAVEVELRRLAELSRLANQGPAPAVEADRSQDTGRTSQLVTERSEGRQNRGSASPAASSLRSGRAAPSDPGAGAVQPERQEETREPWLQELSDALAKNLKRVEAERRRAERRATQAQQEVFRARREDARAARAAEAELAEARRELKASEMRRAPRRDGASGRLEATLTAVQDELREQRSEAAAEARRQRSKEQEDLPKLVEAEEQRQAVLQEELRGLEARASQSQGELSAQRSLLGQEEAAIQRLRQEVEQAEATLAARLRPRPRSRQVSTLREDLVQASEQEEQLLQQLEVSRQQVVQLEAAAAGFAEALRGSEAAAETRRRQEAEKVQSECRDLQDQLEALRAQQRALRAAEAAVARASQEPPEQPPPAPAVQISRDQLEQSFRVEYDHLEARADAAAAGAWAEELRRWGRELLHWRSRSQQLLNQPPSATAAAEIRAAEEECAHAEAKAETVESAVLRSHETRLPVRRTQKPAAVARGRGGARGTAKPAPGRSGYSPLNLLRSVLKVEEQLSTIETEAEEVAGQVAQTLQVHAELRQQRDTKVELFELEEEVKKLEAAEKALKDQFVEDFASELHKEVVAGYRGWQQTTEAELRRKAELAQSEHEEAYRALDVWRGRRGEAQFRLERSRADAEALHRGLAHVAEKQAQSQKAVREGMRRSRELQDAYEADAKEACRLSEHHGRVEKELGRLQANLAAERHHTAEVEEQLRSVRSQKAQVGESARDAAMRLATLRRRSAEKERREDLQWVYDEEGTLPSSRMPQASEELRRAFRTELEEAFSNA